LGVPFVHLAYFAVESLCLVSEGTPGPPCPGGEQSCDNASLPGTVPATNPNLGTLGHLRNEMRVAEQMRQTNPIPGPACGRGIPTIPSGGVSCQTKPNLGDLGYLESGVEGLVQTNPIWRDAGPAPYRLRPARGGCTNKANRLEPIVRNKPNSAGRDAARRTNKPNLPLPDGQARPWSGPIAPKKPNCPRRGTEAMSVVAAFGSPIIPVFHHSHHSSPCRLCQTKPNLGAPGVSGVRRGGEPIARNKANLAGRDTPTFQYSTIPAFQRDAVRAKQTQSATDGQGRPSSRACPEHSEWARGLGDATPQRAVVSKPVAHGKLDFALRGLPISPGSGRIRLLWLHPHSQRQER
jgi:hypothetical protein